MITYSTSKKAVEVSDSESGEDVIRLLGAKRGEIVKLVAPTETIYYRVERNETRRGRFILVRQS